MIKPLRKMPKRFNLKFDAGIWEIEQVRQRKELLQIYFETKEDNDHPVINLIQLKKAKEEIEDFKRFLKFHRINRSWDSYLE